ncbi:NotI family restriction endonuclease [Streptomyces sp. SID12488]|uniref:NotI family restriction endonuclease n=1 Tax=Streptomyces sp. SID12488 TaxID=2706040 RepID=UPI0013DD7A80|nr:NotI family restriction endonuclease [Streptomyces sp. SID12488]NEA65354.1 hypothetical protein [Streptomyces sp. SID12488]
MSGGTIPKQKQKKEPNNFIGEWFGHRVYPVVAQTAESLYDQEHQRCPFLTIVKGEDTSCTKREASKGVCSISSTSNGVRQDWLVCPHRALDTSMLESAAHRLFGFAEGADVEVLAATVLDHKETAEAVRERVAAGLPTIVYFQEKLGGEIGISAGHRSPELSFDATMIELVADEQGKLCLGRYGIFEIQTMDFHGGYSKAVANLNAALHMHQEGFGDAVSEKPWWLAEKVEGPNIANVFKRTFYQMMFKFQLGADDSSAGCIFAIPRSVWDSWQRHLGRPELIDYEDGTWRLMKPDHEPVENPPAWIYVFDTELSETETPNSLKLWRIIGTDAATLSYYALEVSPDAALKDGTATDKLQLSMKSRLGEFLPELKPPRPPRKKAMKKVVAKPPKTETLL